MASIKDEVVVNLIGELPLLSSIVLDGLKKPAHLFLGYTLRAYSYVISVLPLGTQSETEARKPTNGVRLLVRGLVKRPGKARPNWLSNSTLEFPQATYQKPYPIVPTS